MTVIICANEHDIVWGFDDRLPNKWFGIPSTPVGTYCSIAAAFVGEPLKVVYLQETESKKILLADPKWLGIFSYLGVELDESKGRTAILAEYSDFVSPYASLIKLAASDYVRESSEPDFNLEIFYKKLWIKYDLQPCQVKTAIRYANKINADCEDDEFFFKLDSIYQGVKDIETMHLSSELERIGGELDASALLSQDLISTTNQINEDLYTLTDFLQTIY